MFHLPFGEITITMDNISSLFLIPLVGKFSTPLLMNIELATMSVETYLRGVQGMILEKFRFNIGAHLRFYWR